MPCTCQSNPCTCTNNAQPIGTGAASPVCTGTSWTVSDIANLERAIASGATTVKYRDHEVTYRSLNEMIRVLNAMRQAVCGTSGAAANTASRSVAVARFTGRGGGAYAQGWRGMDY